MSLEILNSRILVVDDDRSQTDFLSLVLNMAGYRNVECINDPRGVLSACIELDPDLILLDLLMPQPDGFHLLNLIHQRMGRKTYLPIFVLTAEASLETRKRALLSGASDFILKPFLPEEVCLRIQNLLRVRVLQRELEAQNLLLEREVQVRTRELESYQLDLREAQIEITLRLARAAEHHDDDTGQHTQRVGLTCSLLAQSIGLPEEQITLIRRAAPLHDVGKIGVPDTILLKPNTLTTGEREIMKRHCEIGADLLAGGKSELVKMAEGIALTHHERWDGSGYPYQLQGDAIPIESRILAVADVFDALTHDRPYKRAWDLDDAIGEIRHNSGMHFDPLIVDAFLQLPHAELV
jgi:putative two-component system response regulator